MSIKKLYKVEDIYFFHSAYTRLFMEEEFPYSINIINKNINLLVNENILIIQVKGIENINNKKNKNSLLIDILEKDKKSLMNILGIKQNEIFIENLKNVYLEIDYHNL